MRPTLRSSVLFVLLCGLPGCGDDPKPEDTGNTQSDDSSEADASGASESTDESEDRTSTTDDSDDTGDTTTDTTDELPEPVLEDLPPETPLSDLDDDELAEVCAAYLETATSITNNLDGICPTQALITASQSEPTSDEEVQQACATAEAMCETQVAASKVAIAQADCAQAESCGATIADFNACNRQIAALDQGVIVPVSELDAHSCENVTVIQASTFTVFAAIQFFGWTTAASEAGGGSPTEENGPCQRLQEQCPELGAALDAFAGLDLPEL